MGVLRELFKSLVPSLKSEPTRPGRRLSKVGSDAMYEANKDILSGLEFCATLQLSTPLSVLEHHGEIFGGPPSKAPRYGNEAEGIWVPKVGWSELGMSPPEPSEHASSIGPIKPAEYLPFLKDFRRIVEQDISVDDKLDGLKTLPMENAAYSRFWREHVDSDADFPESFYYLSFADIPGVGNITAKNLFRAGFKSMAELGAAPADALLAVPGVGKGTLAKLKEHLATHAEE